MDTKLKKGEVILIAFAVFSKAFVTVDYSVVLRNYMPLGLPVIH